MRPISTALILLAIVMATAAVPVSAQQQGFFYTVRGGDTLSGIAAANGLTTQQLAQANNISNSNRLFAGQVLFIPVTVVAPAPQPTQPFGIGGPAAGVIVAPNNPAAPTPVPTQVIIVQPTNPAPVQPVLRPTYTVRTGDTLFEIAVLYGTTAEAIAQLNGITNINQIRAGQVLVLPQGATLQFGTGGVGGGSNTILYEVQAGDYLELLSARFGVSVEAIEEANDLEPGEIFFPGDVFVIPR